MKTHSGPEFSKSGHLLFSQPNELKFSGLVDIVTISNLQKEIFQKICLLGRMGVSKFKKTTLHSDLNFSHLF